MEITKTEDESKKLAFDELRPGTLYVGDDGDVYTTNGYSQIGIICFEGSEISFLEDSDIDGAYGPFTKFNGTLTLRNEDD